MTTDHEWLELIACHLTNRVEDLVRSPLPPEIAKLLTQLLAAGGSNPDPVIRTQDVSKRVGPCDPSAATENGVMRILPRTLACQ